MPEPNFNLHEIMITMLATQRVDYMDYDDKVCPVHFLFFHSIFFLISINRMNMKKSSRKSIAHYRIDRRHKKAPLTSITVFSFIWPFLLDSLMKRCRWEAEWSTQQNGRKKLIKVFRLNGKLWTKSYTDRHIESWRWISRWLFQFACALHKKSLINFKMNGFFVSSSLAALGPSK